MVAPDAEVKVYLTADPEARAARRTAEQAGTDVAAAQADLLRRDRIDCGRTTVPLAMADDATHIDTTPYTLDEVVSLVVALVERQDREKVPRDGSVVGAGRELDSTSCTALRSTWSSTPCPGPRQRFDAPRPSAEQTRRASR